MAAVYAPPTIITTAADGRSRRASPLPSPVHSPSASASPPAANNASSSSYSSSSAAATTNSSPFPFNAAPGFSAVRRSLRRKPAPAPVPPPAAPLPPPPPSQAIRPARYPASPVPTTPTSAGAISLGDDASPERVVRSLDLASGAGGSGSGSSSGSGGGAGGSDDYSSLSSASASYGYYDGGYGNAASSPAQNGAAVGGADSIAARPLAPSSPSRASAPPSRPVVAAVHARLASEPASRRPPPAAAAVRLHLRFRSVSLAPKPDMAKPIARKPAPILVDAPPKQQPTKLSSFFAWKPTTPSPGPPDSAMTDASFDGAASPANAAASSAPTSFIDSYPSSLPKTPRTPQRAPPTPVLDPDLHARLADLEHGVRDVSAELAASVRREMELEELLDRMPDAAAAAAAAATADRRTSDYFSDTPSDPGADRDRDRSKPDLDVNRLRRAAEQERALLKAELSQKWQDERARRQASEAHVQILESQVNAFRAERVDVSNLSARARELDVALEDTRRRLTEERIQKENFEDLLTGMRVDLEQHRNERDRLQAELKIALAAGSAAGGRVKAIAEEGTNANSSFGGGALSRSNSLARASPKRSSDGLSRSGSLTRSTSVLSKDREPRESSGDRLRDLEIQRDLLHQTVKNLLVRQKQAAAQSAKDLSLLTRELDRERVGSPRRRGYERDVRSLREEVNLLRRRADDALVTKWQCEKGLAGVKIDLDRAEMETSSLRALLNEQRSSTGSGASSSGDDTDNFHLSALSLEEAYNRNHADADASEDDLSIQIRDQVATNRTLLSRLSAAVGRGEVEQRDSATRITELQSRLRFLEDALVMAQQVSEEEVSKHEAEVHFLRDAHNAQLQRIRAGQRSAGAAAAASPGGSTIAAGSPLITTVTAGQSPTLSPGNSTPRPGGAVAAAAVALTPKLDVTTSGMGIPLTRAVQTEDMEKKVRELEAALREADREMAEVVGRVNESQIEVAELQMERDAALRETKRLKKQMR